MTQGRKAASRRKTAYHHGDLRAALISAATKEVDGNGHESVSLSELARLLGVSQPACYRHFAGRDALLVSVATETFKEFTNALRSESGLERTGSLDLRKMAHAYVSFGREHAGLYRLMFDSRLLGSEPPDSELLNAAWDAFALLLSATNPKIPDRLAAMRIWSGLHGIVMLLHAGLLQNENNGISLNDLIDSVLA
jgi:AcrR family transcriptional regulator